MPFGPFVTFGQMHWRTKCRAVNQGRKRGVTQRPARKRRKQ